LLPEPEEPVLPEPELDDPPVAVDEDPLDEDPEPAVEPELDDDDPELEVEPEFDDADPEEAEELLLGDEGLVVVEGAVAEAVVVVPGDVKLDAGPPPQPHRSSRPSRVVVGKIKRSMLLSKIFVSVRARVSAAAATSSSLE
jgi:hypothetical protein